MVDVRFRIRAFDEHGVIYRLNELTLPDNISVKDMKRIICTDVRNRINIRNCVFIYKSDIFLPDNITLSDLERDYGADLDDEVEINVRDRTKLTGPILNKYKREKAQFIQSKYRDRMLARKLGDESRSILAGEGRMTQYIKEKDWPIVKGNIKQMLKESAEDYNEEGANEILSTFKREHYDLTDELPRYYDQYGKVLSAPWKGGRSLHRRPWKTKGRKHYLKKRGGKSRSKSNRSKRRKSHRKKKNRSHRRRSSRRK